MAINPYKWFALLFAATGLPLTVWSSYEWIQGNPVAFIGSGVGMCILMMAIFMLVAWFRKASE